MLPIAADAMGIGDVAPDFSRVDVYGKQVKLSELRGGLVLLNFWATWCAPCREEMPEFSRWQRAYGAKGLRIIGVSMDDDVESVRQVLAGRPVSYPIVMGDARFGESFGGVLGLPLSYLIDAHGRVVARYQGEIDLPRMEARLRELISPPRR
jgi:cytochrome c biogenesis protein CcmG/thiol:disulfide interchange protein DsbE